MMMIDDSMSMQSGISKSQDRSSLYQNRFFISADGKMSVEYWRGFFNSL